MPDFFNFGGNYSHGGGRYVNIDHDGLSQEARAGHVGAGWSSESVPLIGRAYEKTSADISPLEQIMIPTNKAHLLL